MDIKVLHVLLLSEVNKNACGLVNLARLQLGKHGTRATPAPCPKAAMKTLTTSSNQEGCKKMSATEKNGLSSIKLTSGYADVISSCHHSFNFSRQGGHNVTVRVHVKHKAHYIF